MTIWTDTPVRRGPFYLEDYQSSLGASVDATAEGAFVTNPINSIMRMRELSRAERGVGPNILDYNLFGEQARSTASEMQDAASARQKIKDEGLSLTVPDEGIRSRALDILIERKKEERRRNDIISRGPGGFVAGATGVGVNLAVSAMDPLNIASAFIPVIGEARYAAMLAKASGPLSRAGARAGVGALEGAAGAAAVEPLVYGAARQEQADYDLHDSIANIALGTVLGGGLHVGAGAIADAVRAGRDWRTARAAPDAPIPRMMESAPPGTREAVLRTGVAQSVSGREINLEPIFQLPGTMERLSELQLGELRTEAIGRFTESEAAIADLEAQRAALTEPQKDITARAAEASGLGAEISSLRADLENTRQRLADISPSLNEATKARLAAIETDLQRPALSKKQRATLEAEQRTITESVAAAKEPRAVRLRDSLGQEVTGLQRALQSKEKFLAKTGKKQADKAHALTKKTNEIGAALSKERSRLQSRQTDAAQYLARSIMELAQEGYRIRLSRSEAEDMASTILAERDNVSAPVKLRSITDALKRKSIAEHGSRTVNAGDLTATAQASFAPEQMRLYDGEAVRIADERIAAAPKDEDMPDVTLTEAMEDVTRLAEALGDPEIVGREMAEVDALAETAAAYGRGVKAAADCRLRRS